LIDDRNITHLLTEILAPLRKANWKVIILCFSTAATFWFFNALNKVYTTRIYYPFELVFNRDSLVAVKDPPEEIPINVTGGGWQLLKRTVSVNLIPVEIKPDNPTQTQYFTAANLLPFFSDQLNDLNINYISTDTIFFKIEPYEQKRLSIAVDSSAFQLKENFFITSNVTVYPDSVTFRGPASLVEKLPPVFMVSLSEKDIDGNVDEELNLDLFSPTLIKKTPENIRISFEAEEFVEQNADLTVGMVSFPYDSSVYLETNVVHANYRVRKSFRNKIDFSEFLIIADLSSIQNADSTINIEVLGLPNYIKDFSIEEKRIKVIYAK
jgi:hypothetical protein